MQAAKRGPHEPAWRPDFAGPRAQSWFWRANAYRGSIILMSLSAVMSGPGHMRTVNPPLFAVFLKLLFDHLAVVHRMFDQSVHPPFF